MHPTPEFLSLRRTRQRDKDAACFATPKVEHLPLPRSKDERLYHKTSNEENLGKGSKA